MASPTDTIALYLAGKLRFLSGGVEVDDLIGNRLNTATQTPGNIIVVGKNAADADVSIQLNRNIFVASPQDDLIECTEAYFDEGRVTFWNGKVYSAARVVDVNAVGRAVDWEDLPIQGNFRGTVDTRSDLPTASAATNGQYYFVRDQIDPWFRTQQIALNHYSWVPYHLNLYIDRFLNEADADAHATAQHQIAYWGGETNPVPQVVTHYSEPTPATYNYFWESVFQVVSWALLGDTSIIPAGKLVYGTPTNGQIPAWSTANSRIEWVDPGASGGATTALALTDTPSAYINSTFWKNTANGVEFVTLPKGTQSIPQVGTVPTDNIASVVYLTHDHTTGNKSNIDITVGFHSDSISDNAGYNQGLLLPDPAYGSASRSTQQLEAITGFGVAGDYRLGEVWSFNEHWINSLSHVEIAGSEYELGSTSANFGGFARAILNPPTGLSGTTFSLNFRRTDGTWVYTVGTTLVNRAGIYQWEPDLARYEEGLFGAFPVIAIDLAVRVGNIYRVGVNLYTPRSDFTVVASTLPPTGVDANNNWEILTGEGLEHYDGANGPSSEPTSAGQSWINDEGKIWISGDRITVSVGPTITSDEFARDDFFAGFDFDGDELTDGQFTWITGLGVVTSTPIFRQRRGTTTGLHTWADVWTYIRTLTDQDTPANQAIGNATFLGAYDTETQVAQALSHRTDTATGNFYYILLGNWLRHVESYTANATTYHDAFFWRGPLLVSDDVRNLSGLYRRSTELLDFPDAYVTADIGRQLTVALNADNEFIIQPSIASYYILPSQVYIPTDLSLNESANYVTIEDGRAFGTVYEAERADIRIKGVQSALAPPNNESYRLILAKLTSTGALSTSGPFTVSEFAYVSDYTEVQGLAQPGDPHREITHTIPEASWVSIAEGEVFGLFIERESTTRTASDPVTGTDFTLSGDTFDAVRVLGSVKHDDLEATTTGLVLDTTRTARMTIDVDILLDAAGSEGTALGIPTETQAKDITSETPYIWTPLRVAQTAQRVVDGIEFTHEDLFEDTADVERTLQVYHDFEFSRQLTEMDDAKDIEIVLTRSNGRVHHSEFPAGELRNLVIDETGTSSDNTAYGLISGAIASQATPNTSVVAIKKKSDTIYRISFQRNYGMHQILIQLISLDTTTVASSLQTAQQQGVAELTSDITQITLWRYSVDVPDEPPGHWQFDNGWSNGASNPEPWAHSEVSALAYAHNKMGGYDPTTETLFIAQELTRRVISEGVYNYMYYGWVIRAEYDVQYRTDENQTPTNVVPDTTRRGVQMRNRLPDGGWTAWIYITSPTDDWIDIYSEQTAYSDGANESSTIDITPTTDLSLFQEIRIRARHFGDFVNNAPSNLGTQHDTIIHRPASGWPVSSVLAAATDANNAAGIYTARSDEEDGFVVTYQAGGSLDTPLDDDVRRAGGHSEPSRRGSWKFKFYSATGVETAVISAIHFGWPGNSSYNRIQLSMWGR